MNRRRATVLALVAELSGVALLASAGALIGWSAEQPSWAAIGGLLLVVELLAFLRAPVRYLGQLAAHDLTTSALSSWRHRLVVGLGASVARLGTPVASGDALERLLADAQLAAEQTQRISLPRLQATTGYLAAVAVAAVAAPETAVLLGCGALGVAAASAVFTPRLEAKERTVATARRALAASAAEAVEAKLELTLLGAGAFLDSRTEEAVRRREAASAQLRRARSAAMAACTLLAAGSAYASAVLLGSRTGVAAVGALVVAVGSLEAMGLATAASSMRPSVAEATSAINALPAPKPARPAPPSLADRPALTASQLCVVGSDGEQLLASCNLEVQRGELVAIVGQSGAGKSTLLAALAGIAPLAGGSSEVEGVPLQDLADADRARLVAYVGHEDGILPGTVRDALTMGRRDLGDEQLLAALEHVDLAETLRSRGGLDLELEAGGVNLSTGERRRLAVARALATEAPVWLLDEPAAGLDPEAANRLAEVVAQLSASRAVVVVTHRDEDAERATRRLVVEHGVLSPTR